MKVGDRFFLHVLDRTLAYEVRDIFTVLPDDTSHLGIRQDEDMCTLITCTPYGINTHRLLIRGHRVSSEDLRKMQVLSDAFIVDRLIVTPIVALPIIFILMLYVFFEPPKKKLPINEEGEIE